MAPGHDQALAKTPVPTGAQVPPTGGAEVRQAEVDQGDEVGAVGCDSMYVIQLCVL